MSRRIHFLQVKCLNFINNKSWRLFFSTLGTNGLAVLFQSRKNASLPLPLPFGFPRPDTHILLYILLSCVHLWVHSAHTAAHPKVFIQPSLEFSHSTDLNDLSLTDRPYTEHGCEVRRWKGSLVLKVFEVDFWFLIELRYCILKFLARTRRNWWVFFEGWRQMIFKCAHFMELEAGDL